MSGFEEINLKDMINYEKSLGKNFFSEGDSLYFKDIELDEEKFTPVVSDWKKGIVTQTLGVKQVRLNVTTRDGEQSTSIYNTTVFTYLYLNASSGKQEDNAKAQIVLQAPKTETSKPIVEESQQQKITPVEDIIASQTNETEK